MRTQYCEPKFLFANVLYVPWCLDFMSIVIRWVVKQKQKQNKTENKNKKCHFSALNPEHCESNKIAYLIVSVCRVFFLRFFFRFSEIFVYGNVT